MNSSKIVLGVLGGIAAGAIAGILFAPEKGSKTRKKILNKGKDFSDEMKGKFDDWAFGCDVCQDVCPWNRFSNAHNESLFNPNPELLSMAKKDWTELTEETFKTVFKNSPLKRTKFEGMKRNLDFLK